MTKHPEILTARLRLRMLVHADAVVVQRLAGDRRVADTTLHIPHPYPDGVAEAWIATREVAWEMGRGLALAITLQESGELVGVIGLSLAEKPPSAELGYWLGVPWWSRGYATEAARGLIAFAFRQLRVGHVHAHHFARNPASGRVLEKAGMHFEGERANALMKWGQTEAARFYRITRADWLRAGAGG